VNSHLWPTVDGGINDPDTRGKQKSIGIASILGYTWSAKDSDSIQDRENCEADSELPSPGFESSNHQLHFFSINVFISGRIEPNNRRIAGAE